MPPAVGEPPPATDLATGLPPPPDAPITAVFPPGAVDAILQRAVAAGGDRSQPRMRVSTAEARAIPSYCCNAAGKTMPQLSFGA